MVGKEDSKERCGSLEARRELERSGSTPMIISAYCMKRDVESVVVLGEPETQEMHCRGDL